MRGRVGAALGCLAWGGGLWAAARVDRLVAALPCLDVARGELGLLLLAVSVAVASARLFEGRLRVRFEPLSAPLLYFASALGLVWLGLHYTGRLRTTGDEPHYLLMAQSLWREGDLDLRDNYAREDFREHTPGPLAPHYGAPRADGRPHPAHGVGLPLLLAPAYGLAGRAGAVILLALAAAALSLQVRHLALRAVGEGRAAGFAWAAAVGPPLAVYAFHVYTEVPSALVLATSLRMLLSSPGPWGAAAAALLAGALPWLHLKMAPAGAALLCLGLWRLRGGVRAAFLSAAGVAALGFLLYQQTVFGSLSPLAVYGGMPRGTHLAPRAEAVVGLLLDRSFGLLPHAPVFLLALAGVVPLCRGRLREAAPHLMVATAVLWPILGWRMWWGGQCPAGRFLVPAVPFLGVAMAAGVGGAARGLARWRWVLLGLGLWGLLFAIQDPGRLLLVNRGARPSRLWAAVSREVPVGRYLPSLVSGTPEEWRVAWVWLAALAVLLGLDRLAQRREAADRLFRGMGLPVVLMLAVGILVDHRARGVPSTRPAPGRQVAIDGGAGRPSGLDEPPHREQEPAREGWSREAP